MNIQKVTVFCGASVGFSGIHKKNAKELGLFLAKNKMTLLYGGGKLGLMGILADAVLAEKGEVIGIIPELLCKEEIVHSNIQKIIVSKTMSERKVLMSKMTDAYVAMPGGFGTLDELFEVITLQQLQIEQKPIGLLNINGFFDATLQQLEVMIKEGFLKPQGKSLLIVANTVDELMAQIMTYKKPNKKTILNKVVQ